MYVCVYRGRCPTQHIKRTHIRMGGRTKVELTASFIEWLLLLGAWSSRVCRSTPGGCLVLELVSQGVYLETV